MSDFFNNINGKDSVLSFSTIPTWMYKNDDFVYPKGNNGNIKDEQNDYEQGTKLNNPSCVDIAE